MSLPDHMTVQWDQLTVGQRAALVELADLNGEGDRVRALSSLRAGVELRGERLAAGETRPLADAGLLRVDRPLMGAALYEITDGGRELVAANVRGGERSMATETRHAGPNEAGYPKVQGRCPSCGSESLFLGAGGYVTCGVIGCCSDPTAPADLLERDPRMPTPLTLAKIAEQGRARSARWHRDDSEPWSGADWSNAMCGEAGEAANVVKKLRRLETSVAQGTYNGDSVTTRDRGELIEQLGDEIADILLYADLLAAHYGVDIERHVRDKFNRVSAAQGFPERL